MEDFNPDELETRYRDDAREFQRWLNTQSLAPEVEATWQARLRADGIDSIGAAAKRKVSFNFPIAVATLVALPFLIPYWLTDRFDSSWAQPWFGLLALSPLMLWHTTKAKSGFVLRSRFALGSAIGVTLFVVYFHNIFENWPTARTIRELTEKMDHAEAEQALIALQTNDLMLGHMPLLLLGLTGAIWCWSREGGSRVAFIRNGIQVAIYTALIVAGGGLFTALSLVMAMMVGLDPEPIATHLLSWGASGCLVFAHHVWLRQPDALQRILPIIAGLFIPLFVLLEAGFLLTYLSKGLGTLSRDREELLVFNLLLAVVIGLVLLHSALKRDGNKLGGILVGSLIVLGIFADLIGIAAIGSRLLEWGMTPNRLTVLGTNLLFLGTLIGLAASLVPGLKQKGWPDMQGILNRALPAFVGWSAAIVLLFPTYQLWCTRNIDMDALAVEVENINVTEQPVESLWEAGSASQTDTDDETAPPSDATLE